MPSDRIIYIIFFLALGLTALLVLYPAYYALELSFQHRESLISEPEWVWFQNYARVLAMPDFWAALGRGVIFAGLTILLQIVLGIGFALLLAREFPGMPVIRGIAVLPYLLPTVVVALTFRWMLDGSVGIFSKAAQLLGYDYLPWGDDPYMAMITVILISVWIWTPFVTLTCLAGLQSIPEDIYEAARIDGAGPWQRFWHITLPQLRSVLLVVLLLRAIWMFNKFDIVWLMTRGGPQQATEQLPIFSYRQAFEMYDVGAGAAVSAISFVILSVLILIYFRLFPLDRKD
ncbi:sugar ABC transporter permease [Marivibrio halodurans]|uniref:Sugar ABC transporter permease n=1 Tax=Marivibrio halodurans TaxID=2039722 RepID=A0A8J7S8S4_9PROT|nr:sugar ABC transporter permease [Marivibrio halodurans]MBP5857482.1 sugar ABC transporter permease [Marivibrio halodurans]